MGWVVPVSEASSSEVPQTPVELETGSVERPAQKLRSVAPSVGGKGASETSGMESDGKVPASPRKGGLTVGVPYSLRVKHGALESSGFGDTLRFMRYRAFLKWYNGAHERTWSRLAAATYCLVAGGSILFSRDTLCPEEAPTNDFLVVHLAGIFGLCIIFLLLSHPLFVTRWAVRISFLYCILSFVLLLSVALRFRYLFTGSSGDGGTSSDEPPDPVCPFSIIFPYSFYGVIAAIVLWGLLYSLVLNRLAAYYYLKSNIFLDHWYVTRCQVVDVLVPAFGQSDKARYQRLVRRHARTTRDVPRGAADGAANIRGLEFGAVQDPSVHRGRKTSFSVAAAAPQHCPAPADRWAPTEKAVKSCPPFGFDERLRVARGVRLECVAESRGEFTLRRIKTFWRRCWFLFCCKRRALARPLAAPVLSFGLTKESPTDVRKGCTRGRFFRPWGQRHWAHKTDSWDPFAPSRRHRRGRRRITFIGEVDSQGKPQGFGAWKEEGYNFGERLVGFWSRGLPDGPYKSRELGTGSGFMCIRIGWAQYALNVDTLRFGVSNVECSVSGKFYRGFPSVTLLSPPEAPVAPSFVPLLKPFDEKDMKIEESSWVTGTTKNVDFNIPAVQKSFPSVFDQVVADLTEAIPSEDNPTADGRVFEDKSGVQVTESPEDKMAVSDLPKLRESALHGSSMYCLPFPCMSPRYENDVFNAGVSSTNFSSVLNTCAVSHALNSAESQDLVLTPVSHTVAVKPAVLMKMERPSGSSSERSSNTSLDYNSLTHGRDMPHRDATYSTVPAQDRGATDTEVAHISGTRRSRAQKTHLRKVRWRRRNRAQRFRFTHVERKNQYQERHQGGPRFFPRKSQSAVCVSQRDNFAGISMSGPTESQSHGFSTSKNKSSRMGDEESIERSDHQDITGSRKPSLRRTNALKKIGRTAMGVPHQIMAGGAAAAGAGVAALRRLRRRDVETIARIEKCRWCIAWSLAELAPHTPNFGVQPRSELIVSVDQERGKHTGLKEEYNQAFPLEKAVGFDEHIKGGKRWTIK